MAYQKCEACERLVMVSSDCKMFACHDCGDLVQQCRVRQLTIVRHGTYDYRFTAEDVAEAEKACGLFDGDLSGADGPWTFGPESVEEYVGLLLDRGYQVLLRREV